MQEIQKIDDKTFNLFVFHRDLTVDQECCRAGVKGIVVDFENRGKTSRQIKYDTQINHHTIQDLYDIKTRLGAYSICRTNSVHSQSKREIKGLIAAGCDEILVPMIKSLHEVNEVFKIVGDRVKIGLMVETVEALSFVKELDHYPLSRLYVGLNDLCISRGSDSIFEAIADGTLDKIRCSISKVPFGFAGLTIPHHGYPLNVEHLFNELTRLDCDFTFLRRSFFLDTLKRNVLHEIPKILAALKKSNQRIPLEIEKDQARLIIELRRIIGKGR